MMDNGAKMAVMVKGYLARVEDMDNNLVLSTWHKGEIRLPLYI